MHVRLTINTIRRIHLQRTPSMSKRELNMKKNERWCKILLLCDIVEQCESRRGKCQAIMWKCLCCAEYSDVKLHNWEFKKFFFFGFVGEMRQAKFFFIWGKFLYHTNPYMNVWYRTLCHHHFHRYYDDEYVETF